MNHSRILIISSLLLIFFLVSCQDQATEENNDDINNETEENLKKEESENNDSGETDVEEVIQDEPVDELDTDDLEVEPLYRINQSNWVVEPITDDAESKVALLTIDDAPDKYALEMAKTLKELDAPAIFFVNGHFLQTEEEQQILRDIYEMGFAIGNHTYNHPNLGDVSEDEQKEEIVELSDLVEEIIGERPKFFRAPHGVNPDFTKGIVAEEGMTMMNWTYGYDYFKPYMNKEKLTEAMVSGEAPEIDINYSLLNHGANLLMHDREWTNEALADIVTGLRDKGYQFVDPKSIQLPSE